MGVFEIALPDGRAFEIEAPSAEAAHKAWQQHGAKAQGPQLTTAEMPAAPEPGISVGQDIKNLLPSLPGHAAAATIGIPGNFASMLGLRTEGTGGVLPTSEDVRKMLQSDAGGGFELYDPKTSPGKFTKAIAENALGALIPGGLGARLANVAIPAIAGEAAGQATAGTAAEPYARLGGALAGGLGTSAFAGQGAARTADALKASAQTTPKQLIAEGGTGFNTARASGAAIDPNDVTNFVNQARTKLANEGLPRSLAGPTHAILDEALASANAAKAAGQTHTAADMVALRKTLVSAADTLDGNARKAAGAVKGEFDDWLKRTTPDVADVLSDAVKNTRVGHLAADIAKQENRATLSASAANSGTNTENRLRQTLSQLLLKEEDKLTRGRATNYSPEVHALLRDLVQGDTKANAMRTAGNYLGGGGGALASVYGLVGAMHNPVLAAAPIVGAIIKAAGNRATLAKVDEISKLVMSGAPLTEQQAAAVSAQIAKAEKIVQSSQISAAKKSAMLQSLQNIRPANVAKAEEDK